MHADHLGSTRLVTGAGGTVGSRIGYSAFGEILASSNPGGAPARSRYGYCGGWGYEDDGLADPGNATLQTGLLHVGARYYSPGIGRFVQRDPIGLRGGINTYSYAFQSPIGFIDPSGETNTPEVVTVASVQAQIVAITAEAATGAAYRGGVKMTITMIELNSGRQIVYDAIVRCGKVLHSHFKCSPPWPAPPLGL